MKPETKLGQSLQTLNRVAGITHLIQGIALAFIVFHEHKLLGSGFYIGAVLIMSTVVGEVLWKRSKEKKELNKEILPES